MSEVRTSNVTVDRRVVVVDDHRLLSQALEVTLSVQGYDVHLAKIPEAGGGPDGLVSSILRLRPRVVLLDLDLGAFGDGLRLIGPLARADVRVVVLTGSADRARWGAAVRAGARKVLSKNQPLSEVIAVVRRADRGHAVMDTVEREELLAAWRARGVELWDLDARLARLSRREAEVLGQLMEGLTVRDVAARGVVSEATVRTQVKSILGKLRVSSQLAAVGLAHRAKWRAPAPS